MSESARPQHAEARRETTARAMPPVPPREPADRALDAAQQAGMVLFLLLTPVTIAGAQIALGVAALAWLGGARRRPLASLAGPVRPLVVPLVVLAAALFAASLTAYDRAASFAKLQKLLLALALFVFASGARDRARMSRCLAALLTGALATSAFGIAAYLASAGGLAARLRGLSGFYMTTSGILMLVLLFLAPQLTVSASRPRRAAVIAALSIVAWALVLTFTRGAWLGVVAGAGVILALTRPRLLLALIAALAVAYFVLPASLHDRVASITDPNHPLNTERIHMWRTALRIARDHPWTGVGLMDMKPLFARYADPTYTGVVHGHFHSNFLQMLAAAGAIGLAAFVLFLAAIARALVRAFRAARDPRERAITIGGLAAFAGFLVEGLFEWNFGDAEVVALFYAIVGMALATALRSPSCSESPATISSHFR